MCSNYRRYTLGVAGSLSRVGRKDRTVRLKIPSICMDRGDHRGFEFYLTFGTRREQSHTAVVSAYGVSRGRWKGNLHGMACLLRGTTRQASRRFRIDLECCKQLTGAFMIESAITNIPPLCRIVSPFLWWDAKCESLFGSLYLSTAVNCSLSSTAHSYTRFTTRSQRRPSLRNIYPN